MSNEIITQEQVNSVANALVAEGITPTVLDVRKRIQGGSMAVIWSYFQLWQSKQDKPAAYQRFTLPTEVQQSIENIVNQQFDQFKAATEKEVVTLRQTNDEIAQEYRKVSELLEKAEADRKKAISTESEATERLEQLQAEMTRMQGEIDVEKSSATQSRMDLVKAQLKLESLSRLESDLDQVYKNLEQERVAKVNAEHAAKSLENRLEAEKTARQKAEKELLDLLKGKSNSSVATEPNTSA